MIWFVDGSSPGPLVSKRVNAIFTLFESIEGSRVKIVHLELKNSKNNQPEKQTPKWPTFSKIIHLPRNTNKLYLVNLS